MRHLAAKGTAAAVAVTLMCVGMAAMARASDYGLELNGTYAVTSNGDWAKTNEVYHDEVTVRATWTITSSCSAPTKCVGEVTSDQGWTAPLRFTEDRWIVDRVVDNWQPCPDGTAASGYQRYMFWGVDTGGMLDQGSNTLAGTDITLGVSGDCGKNLPLSIRLPLRLTMVSQ